MGRIQSIHKTLVKTSFHTVLDQIMDSSKQKDGT